MAELRTLRLLLKEIKDPYVQENFYKLKLYLEDLVSNGGVPGPTGPQGPQGPVGPTPTSVPRLIQTFTTDAGTIAGDLVYISATNTVTKLPSNDPSYIPNGYFGVVYSKPSTLVAEVMFIGLQAGYVGLTPTAPVFISTSGTPVHTGPATGIVQQIGFAVSSTEIFFLPQQPMRRA